MPVSCVLALADPPDDVVAAILRLRSATDLGTPWSAEFRKYQKAARKREGGAGLSGVNNHLTVATHSDRPGLCFADAGPRPGLLEATGGFDQILAMLAGLFRINTRRVLRIDGRATLAVADFQIKVGSLVDQQGKLRGTVAEVVYAPCGFEDVCQPLMAEFVSTVFPGHAYVSAKTALQQMDDTDTAANSATTIITAAVEGSSAAGAATSPREYGGRDLTAQYLALLGKDGKNII